MVTMAAMRKRTLWLLCLASTVFAADPFVKQELPPLPSGRIVGGELTPDRSAIVTWGTGLWRWPVAGGNPKRLLVLQGAVFGEGGCFADVNQDGKPDLVLEERPTVASLGKLIWLEAPHWQRHQIDTGIEMSECQEVNLLGHRGILMVQRHMQVRFYEPPASAKTAERWDYQEVYSFYTPSRQAGLLLADIDQDGHQDILCGNYWIKSPEQFELPWHLFAIELYNETPKSATLRLTVLNGGRDLFVAQRDMPDARVTWLERPANPRQLWIEHRLEIPGGVRFVSGLLVGNLDGTGATSVLVGENNGPQSRLILLKKGTQGGFNISWETKTTPILQMLPIETGFIAIGPTNVTLFRKIMQGAASPSASMR